MKFEVTMPTQKEVITVILFFLSLLHPYLILVFFVYLLYNSLHSIKDGVKGLLLIAIRTILNPALAINIDSVQLYKWLVIFALCFIILLHSRGIGFSKQISVFILLEILFCVYICCISIVNSSYPIVSIFKCFSYGFVFLSVVIGISCSVEYIDWSKTLYHYISTLMFFSMLISPFSIAYYSKANWFMGVTNQSQMFGIMAALYSSLVLIQIMKGNRSFFQYAMLIVVTILTFLSGSRTGMIATVICLAYGYYVEVFKNKKISVLIISIVVVGIIFMWFAEPTKEIFSNFILKDSYGTNISGITLDAITASRRGQYEMFMQKFNNDKLFGSGFMVPYVPEMQTWMFSFGLIVESGNLFYSILGDLGIIGSILFFGVYGYMFCVGEKRNGRMILFLAPFLVNMGEMVFFSTNNNAIILYAMLAIFMSEKT